MIKTTKRMMTLLAALGALATSAHAAPQLCSGTTDFQCPDGPPDIVNDAATPFTSPDLQWDPQNLPIPTATPMMNRELRQAEVKFTVTISGSIDFENNNDNDCEAGEGRVEVLPSLDFTSPFFSATNVGSPVQFVSGFLGPGESESLTVPETVIYEECLLFQFPDPNLGDFESPPLNVLHSSNSSVITQSFCGSDFDISTDFDARLTAEVRYLYCGDDPPPPTCPDCIREPRSPSSLLLFPEFNNELGRDTLVTITNASCNTCSNQFPTPQVTVEVVFINEETCLEDNFNIPMTDCDTYTFLTKRKTNFRRGYLYAFAKQNGQAVKYDHLTGQQVIVDGFRNLDWSVNATGFRAGLQLDEGDPTDLANFGVRDLDGLEYYEAPDKIIVPRFLGQSDNPFFFGEYRSTLTLIALSGGAAFETIVDFGIWNDSEECFSAQREFFCWDKEYLSVIAPAFRESFLDSTNNDPNEIVGWTSKEAGWFYVDGRIANRIAGGGGVIVDPAIYAILVEERSGYRVADLPWEYECQDNGALVPLN